MVDDIFLDTREAAKLLKTNPATIRLWIHRGTIPNEAVKHIGSKVLIVKETLMKHIMTA